MELTESRTEALRPLNRAANRSRRSSVAYSPWFVRPLITVPGIPSVIPPLARLIQGGRGGEARLKLYLLLTMIATGHPYDIRNPPNAMTFARALDLPPATGARRITSNMKWLVDHRFIEVAKRPGQTPAIQLMDLQERDRPLRNPRGQTPYVSFPIGFWRHGWLLTLSPVAIAVLFALREHLGGSKVPRFMLRDRRESYGLSHDTWTRGEHELKDAGLLTVKRVPQGDEWAYNRLRNSYWLDVDLLKVPLLWALSEL